MEDSTRRFIRHLCAMKRSTITAASAAIARSNTSAAVRAFAAASVISATEFSTVVGSLTIRCRSMSVTSISGMLDPYATAFTSGRPKIGCDSAVTR